MSVLSSLSKANTFRKLYVFLSSVRPGIRTYFPSLDICQPIYAPKADSDGARSKAWFCSRSLAGIAGSNPAGGMDVCPCEY